MQRTQRDGFTRMRERVRRVHTRMYERAVPSTPRTCNMLPSACVLCECVTAIALGYNKRQGEPRCRAASLLSSTTRVPSPGYGLWRNTPPAPMNEPRIPNMGARVYGSARALILGSTSSRRGSRGFFLQLKQITDSESLYTALQSLTGTFFSPGSPWRARAVRASWSSSRSSPSSSRS